MRRRVPASMAMSDGAIPLGCKRAMAAKSQPAEAAELVGSSSPAVTPPPPPTETRASDDGDSEGDDEAATDFERITDHQLQESIKRTRHSLGMCARLRDGGVKFLRRIRRMEKELDRRRAAGLRKVSEMWVFSNRSGWRREAEGFWNYVYRLFFIIISSRFHDPWIFFFLRGYVWVRNFEE